MAKWPVEIPIFPYLPFHLEIVGGVDWVQATDPQGHITGILPYAVKQKWGLSFITPPALSPRLGPWVLVPPDKSPQDRLAYERHTLQALEGQLPAFDYARIHWPYTLSDGLAWQLKGWRQSVRYSYCLDLAPSMDDIFNGFQPHTRRHIRKAQQQLQIGDFISDARFFQLASDTFARQGLRMPFDDRLLSRLTAAWMQAGQGRYLVASDALGRVHAALFWVWDAHSAIYWLPFSDTALRQSGAASLLVYEAIRQSKALGLSTFDFEGSHLPGVEQFFRGFGGMPQPYYQFEKGRKWLMCWR
ncbi:MAG: GNAT family N-acetyltransferase [Saprospiraceae bacterium]